LPYSRPSKKGEKKVPRKTADLIIENASELATPQGGRQRPLIGKQMQTLRVIKNAAIGIKDGKIVAVGKTATVKSMFKATETIDAKEKTLVPGFVDPHTHLVFAGSREIEFEMRLKGASYMEIHREGGGILKTVKETRQATEDELTHNCQRTLDTMLEHGTTTVEAKSGYGLTTKDEAKCLRVIQQVNKAHAVDLVPTFLGAHAIPLEYEENTEDYVDLVVEEMIPSIASARLAEFCDVFCEEGAFTVEQARRILHAGIKHGLTPKLHADELTPFGGAELAAETGAVSAEHLLYASEAGLKMMSKRRVIAVLLPAASFTLMTQRYADARRMIELSIPIALGTDFNPSCWVESQQLVIAMACRQLRLTPAEVLAASTLNAAHAVNRAAEIGSLEKGKKADVLILDVPNHSFLGYRFGTNLVSKVIKEGKLVVDLE
jgi:imidazolonepropionase